MNEETKFFWLGNCVGSLVMGIISLIFYSEVSTLKFGYVILFVGILLGIGLTLAIAIEN